jgi:hypothetical protein
MTVLNRIEIAGGSVGNPAYNIIGISEGKGADRVNRL